MALVFVKKYKRYVINFNEEENVYECGGVGKFKTFEEIIHIIDDREMEICY